MLLSTALTWLIAQVPEPPAPADDIRWTAPPGCPDRTALLAGIERRRGRALGPNQVRMNAAISATSGRFELQLTLEILDHEEHRTLSATRCAALVDAAALMIAVAIDARIPAEPPPSEPPPSESPPSESPPTEPPPTESPVDTPPPQPLEPAPDPLPPPPPPAPRPRFGGFVRVQGGLDIGGVPGPTGAVGLAFGLLWRRARLELRPLFLAPRTTAAESHRLQALHVGLAAIGCARLGRGALELPLCGGFEGGVTRGVVTDPNGATSVVPGPWLAPLLNIGLTWRPTSRLALWAAVEGLVPVRRTSFQLRDPAGAFLLFQPASAALRLLVGLELRFRDPR